MLPVSGRTVLTREQVQLAKAMPPDVARSTLGSALKEALARGSRLALQLGTSPPNLRRFCDSQMPIEAFEHEKTGEVARTLGLEAAEAPNFPMVLLVEMSKATAEKALPQVLPGFDEMAVMLLDDATLPSNSQLDEASRRPTSLRSALSLLAVDAAKTAAPTAPTEAPEALVEGVVVNEIDFEYVEKFGEDWQERWPRPRSADIIISRQRARDRERAERDRSSSCLVERGREK